MFPAIFTWIYVGAIVEEKNDMYKRFPEQYDKYRQTTRMFGPIWIWGALILFLAVLISAARAHTPLVLAI
jgi:protein-S-isoprenylcysteine O-methyltransferase Ste14